MMVRLHVAQDQLIDVCLFRVELLASNQLPDLWHVQRVLVGGEVLMWLLLASKDTLNQLRLFKHSIQDALPISLCLE